MNISLRLFLYVAFILIFSGCTIQKKYETVFYVSLSGNDNNPGIKKKSFATFERARDAIKELKKAGPLPEKGITV